MDKLKSKKSGEWGNIYHLVVLPFASEEKTVVAATLDSLVKVNYPKDKIIVLMALEDNSRAREILDQLEPEYRSKFFAFWSSVHPKGIAGELQGKGANVNWAINQVKEKNLPELGIPTENIMVSLFDIDTKPYPQYFSCLAWHYLNAPDRLRKSYQPIPVYNNNIWEAPLISRIVATSCTFFEMMQQERPEQLVTFSSHSMPLEPFWRWDTPITSFPTIRGYSGGLIFTMAAIIKRCRCITRYRWMRCWEKPLPDDDQSIQAAAPLVVGGGKSAVCFF